MTLVVPALVAELLRMFEVVFLILAALDAVFLIAFVEILTFEIREVLLSGARLFSYSEWMMLSILLDAIPLMVVPMVDRSLAPAVVMFMLMDRGMPREL